MYHVSCSALKTETKPKIELKNFKLKFYEIQIINEQLGKFLQAELTL